MRKIGKDDGFYASFVEKTVDAASKIVISYGLDESVQMGPVRDKGEKAKIIGDINNGIAEGAKVLLDGRQTLKSRVITLLAVSWVQSYLRM